MAGAEAVLTNYPDVRASSASAERQQVALTSTHRQKHAAGQMGSPKSASKAVAKTLAQSPAPRTSQPPRTASKPPQYDEGSRKLAALGLGMLVLMGAPIMSLEHTDPATGRYRVYYFSPVQAAALAIQDMTPKLSSLAQGLTLPATFMLEAGRLLRDCRGEDKSLCDLSTLTDLKGLLAKGDVAPVLPIFKQRFTQSYLMILYSGGLVVTLSSLVGLYRPIRTGVLGFVLLLVACHMTPGAGFLPTLIMESFLSAYVLFYSPDAMNKEAEEKARKQAEKQAKAAKAAASSPGQSGTPSQRKKANVDKKSLYDI